MRILFWGTLFYRYRNTYYVTLTALEAREVIFNMADKFQEFAGRLGKAPRGVGTGAKLLAAAALAAYGIKESIFTGKMRVRLLKMWDFEVGFVNVDDIHRARCIINWQSELW